MKKRFILSLLIISLLVAVVVVKAETPNTSSTIYTDSTKSDTGSVNINTSTTTKTDESGVTINGTIMRSINLQRTDTLYRPKLSDLPSLKNLLIKNMNMAAVYTGEYDTDSMQSDYKVNKRELEVLGKDILLAKDSYNNSGKLYTSTMIGNNISRENAIMSIYKSLGKSEYKIDMYSVPSTSSKVSLKDSPLLELVQSTADFVDGSRYYTDVFVTRTLPDKYWGDAIKDGIVSVGYNTSFSRNTMTTGEFCTYISNMLDLKGEPVLTQDESNMLLLYYGKDLPTYLQSNQLEAVKYLIVRGVVETSIDFRKNLDSDTMLKILMRAKDVNSRLTFKNIQIPYNKGLIEKGFYPTQTEVIKSPMSNISFNINSESATYDDYFVKVIDGKTTFVTSNNKEQNNIFVANVQGDDTNNDVGNQYEGSIFYGIEKGYYHFRVPISMYQTNAISTIGGTKYITINTPNPNDNPKYVKLEIGGGVYNDINDKQLMSRNDFNSDYLNVYIDKERRLNSQNNIATPKKLAGSNSVTATLNFYSSSIGSLLWNAEPFTKLKAEGSDPKLVDNGDSTFTLTVTASDPYQLILSSLTYSNAASSEKVDVMPAYINNGKIAMVSLSYLKKNNLLESVIKTGEGQYMLYGEHSNIFVDVNKKMIISGSVVTEITDSDPSPLIEKDETSGEYLIDYRAVRGVSNGFLILKNDKGNVALTLTNTKVSSYKFNSIFPLLGNSDSMSIRSDNKNNFLLEDTYELSNYIIYKARKGTTSGDYLLVFTPHITGKTSTSESNRKMLKSNFNMTLDAKHDCNIYRLDQKVIYQDTTNNKVTSSIIKSDYGYIYKVPLVSKFNYTKYLSGEEPNILPYANFGTESSPTYGDFNVNVLDEKSYNVYNGNLINPSLMPSIASPFTRWTYNFDTNKLVEVSSYPQELKFSSIAIAGVQSKYYPFENLTWGDIKESTKKYDTKVAYGSMLVSIRDEQDIKGHNYDLYLENYTENARYILAENHTGALGKDFRVAFKGTHFAVYIYDAGTNSIVTSDTKPNDSVETMWGKGIKSTFDFLEYFWNHKLTTLDDFMTISILFLLNIVPRIMMFDFFALAALSLVARYPLTQKLCYKYFDVYKVLSLGFKNCENIDAKTMWISTFFGGVFLGMVQGGAILNVLTTLMDSALKILGR